MTLKPIATLVAALALTAPAMAADMTWTGQISDAMCGVSHKDMLDKGETDKQCTLECAKGDGSFVFVTGGKVFKLANPRLKGIEEHAGETVKLTGALNGDAITVTKVEAAK
ncbi:MAG: hypothetical protein ACM3SQ_20220 [Betaproteobacteria bacterium]